MDRKEFDNYVLPTYKRFPITLVKGRGMQVWDDEGNEYLDFFPGWGSGNIGHCHPKVVAALHEQLDKIMHVPNVYYNEKAGELAKLIIKDSFDGQVFFGNSGAEANEGALKLVRKRNPNKKTIITLNNSFHGRTLATVTATGQSEYQKGFDPLLGGFVYCDINDCAMLASLMNENVAAIMLEVVQGEGGITAVTREFIQTARELCNQFDAMLIIDEVQTGIGRTGKMFAYQHFDVQPDVMTLAKSLGGGMPIGAFAVARKYCNILQPGSHGSTFGGSPLACAAGIAVFQAIHEENLLENAVEMGAYFRQKLEELKSQSPLIREIRGLGLMLGVELTKPGAEIVDKCRAQNLLINCTHQTVLRLMPAINVTKEQIDKAVAIIGKALLES
ncbi:MAG TPA: aspartate aminotransferase family protein [Candidatus Marinimicrobia bacterium]|nr:aspartate aminotransferase family protein [Candidatus Neomarinimicrobiota bacterium]HRS51713.1 aspartate aminotransferase family protein [Candidatus Neomarinimicrobiota bacterium]HRU92137.1 aspartate aminotransferase family protein [Candidatus Neomarinimicrobiota bacterium]